MRNSMTAVIEQGNTFATDFATEPYEVAWASEARWFVRLLDWDGDFAGLEITPQISPDGLVWCDEGSVPIRITEKALYSFPLREFGHWLRVRGSLDGGNASVKLLVYLALKE